MNGDRATLDALKDKKVIVGGTALELGDRFSIPNGGIVSGPVLQALASELIIRGRALHWTSATTTLAALCALMLAMYFVGAGFAARRVGALACGRSSDRSVGLSPRDVVSSIVIQRFCMSRSWSISPP